MGVRQNTYSKDMSVTPPLAAADVAELVRERYPNELNERHDEIAYVIDTGKQHDRRADFKQEKIDRLRPAITLPDTSVRFEFAFSNAGRNQNVENPDMLLIFQALVIGYKNGKTVSLPDDEAEGWARAVLGPELCKYAYKVEASDEHPRERRSFPVLVDRNIGPIHPPAGFDWSGKILEKMESETQLTLIPLVSD